MDTDARKPIGWIDASPSRICRTAFAPYDGAGISHLFDWGENPNGRSAHVMPYRGQMIVDIVEIEANAVHQPNKPGDEVVVVVSGTLVLTTDATKEEQVFMKGEAVLIPRGWAGLYRVIPGNDMFLEFTIVPHDYFTVKAPSPPSGASPQRIAFPAGTGKHVIHAGSYMLETERRPATATWRISNQADEITYIKAGELTLGAGDRKMTFGAGDAVVLPAGLTCQAFTAGGYEAFTARWLG